jgi:hypothetical protein
MPRFRTAIAVPVLLVAATACGPQVSATLHSSGTSAQSAVGRSQNPRRVSAHGDLLAQFESLLRSTFPHRGVCANANTRTAVVFNTQCSPIADHQPYLFTFRGGGPGQLTLAPRPPKPGSLGNYPVPIRLRADYVRCQHHGYLIAYSDTASFSLQCDRGL